MSNQQGFYAKYVVRKIEHSNYFDIDMSREGLSLTDVFVLRPEKDPAALEALIRYAESTDNVLLHDDLWRWIERIKSNALTEENDDE